jgi:hypothetical protein
MKGSYMKCQRCNSTFIITAGGKCSDLFNAEIIYDNGNKSHTLQCYVPRNLGIGGDDYMEIKYCGSCGQLQGKFPLNETDIIPMVNPDDPEYS